MATDRARFVGPNHRDGCDASVWRHSGDGYNRVRVCSCGAEDHDPTPESVRSVMSFIRERYLHGLQHGN